MGGQAVCDPNTTSSSSSTGAPVSGGLKTAWGLTDPPSLDESGASEQAKKAIQDFKAAMGQVNQCLQFTKGNAVKEKHEAMVAKRDYLYTAFQSVLTEIDPNDEAKAKDKIKKVLTDAQGLATEAEKLFEETEKSQKAWQAKSSDFDKAVQQIEELDGFEFKGAADHRKGATEIQKAVNENKFDEAVARFGQLDTNLKPAYAEYTKQKENKEYYEKKRKDLKPRMDKLVAEQETPFRKMMIESEWGELTNRMDAFVAVKDWLGAKGAVDMLETRTAQYEKESEQRKADKEFYDEHWPPLATEIDKVSGAPFEETKTAVTELGKAETEMLGFATAGQYDKARPILEKLPAALDKLDQTLRTLYEKTWAELKKQLPTAAQKGSPKEVELVQQLSELCKKVESTAASGEYVAALKQISEVKAKLKELTDEHEAYEKRKKDFETRFAGMKDAVEVAVGTPTDVKEVKATQDAVKAKKTAVEAAATAGDYEAGIKRLDELDAALKAHQEELRKSPQDCIRVLAICIELIADINIKYMQVNSKIMIAAQAYDDALKEHTGALRQVSAAKELATSILVGIFFAGLGGLAGGAVVGGMKSSIEDAFGKAAQGNALLDATKNVVGFTTRSLEKFGGKAGDPTAKLPDVGGSGTELARKVGKSVNDQGAALLDEVKKLSKLVGDNPVCKDGGTVRVEGDPLAALDKDPFLNVLGMIANVDKKKFAQLLWEQWINTYAFTTRLICHQGGCNWKMEDNVEGFWGWWGDLAQTIEDQAGTDFGLRPRLDAARAEAEANRRK